MDPAKRARWLAALLLGVLPASAVILGIQPGEGEPERPVDRQRRVREGATVELAREELDVQAFLGPLRKLMAGSLEEWQTGPSALTEAGSNDSTKPAESRCRVSECTRPPVPIRSRRGKTYVFVMGVEGAGHHAVCPFLEDLLLRSGYPVYVDAINMFGRNSILPFSAWKDKFMRETASWCPSGICLNCYDSFPYERPILSTASPDFARMAALHESGDIDLRVISVMRNISDSVFSAMRRFTEDPTMAFAAARHFFMEVVRNTDKWQKDHCERLGTLRYENLMGMGTEDLPSVLRALGMDPASDLPAGTMSMTRTLKEQHGHKYRDVDTELYDKVSSWFREKEDFLWPEARELWCN